MAQPIIMAKEGDLMSNRREFGPMTGTWANPEKVVCKDCAFRDKTVVEALGKKYYSGITSDFCKIYEEPPKTNGKPSNILFQNANCKYYQKDE